MIPEMVHSNIEPKTDEGAVDLTEVMVVLEKQTNAVEKKQTIRSKKVALALIDYGLVILLLSLNISTNMILASTCNIEQMNHTENNYCLCSVNELTKHVTLTCRGGSIQKIFYLGKDFDFTTCTYS